MYLYIISKCSYTMILIWGLLAATFIREVFGRLDDYDGPYSCSCDSVELHFLPLAVSKLQCCSGFVQCKEHDGWNNSVSAGSMLCFSETSCLLTGSHSYNTSNKYSSICKNLTHECLHKSLNTYDISNTMGQISKYQCIFTHNMTDSLCLLPLCDSFAVIERICSHNESNPNFYTCYGPSELHLVKQEETDALFPAFFLSFADDYGSQRNSNLSAVKVLLILVFTLLFLGCLVMILRYAKIFQQCLCFYWQKCRTPHSERNSAPVISKIPASSSGDDGKKDDTLPSYEEATGVLGSPRNGPQTLYTIPMEK